MCDMAFVFMYDMHLSKLSGARDHASCTDPTLTLQLSSDHYRTCRCVVSSSV